MSKTNEKSKEIKALIKSIESQIDKEKKDIHGVWQRSQFTKNRSSEFDEVYRLYGPKAYMRYVPKKIQEQNLEKKIEEGDYEAVLDIYGEKKFRSILDYARKTDVEFEAKTLKQRLAGMIRYVLPIKTKKLITSRVIPITLASLSAPGVLLAASGTIEKNKEKEDYKTEIEEYLDDVEAYGNKYKQSNLTTLQAMMKVTSDMWERIDGYGAPKLNLIEYAGIDVSKNLGVGVCRNMADDCARRLNAIDEKYNARTLVVVHENGEYTRANIPLKIVKDEKTQQDAKAEIVNNKIDKFLDSIKNIVGDHVVVLVDDTKNDVTLVFDPTNAAVGLFHNGKISMFSSGKEHPVELKITPYGESRYGLGKALIEYPNDLLSSLGMYPTEKMEKLESEYGVEAQNKAIDEIMNLDNIDKKEAFVNSLKIEENDISQKDKEMVSSLKNQNKTYEQDINKSEDENRDFK